MSSAMAADASIAARAARLTAENAWAGAACRVLHGVRIDAIVHCTRMRIGIQPSCPFLRGFAPMAKSLSKIWLRGLKRLLAIQSEHAHKTAKRATTRPVRPAATKPSTKVRPSATIRTPAKREA
ncbi:MAG TPA: hypothetical protein VF573_01055, partial [Paraburkholderia sp.]